MNLLADWRSLRLGSRPSRGRPVASLFAALILAGCSATGELGEPQGEVPMAGISNLTRLAEATLAGGDVPTAIDLYRRAIERAPDAVEPRRSLADAYFSLGALTEARIAYAALLDDTPLEARLGLGRVALAMADAAAARDHFTMALDLAPDRIDALNGLAVAHDMAGAHAAAQALYVEALERDPTNRAVASNQALSLMLQGDALTAIERLTPLAQGALGVPQARHNLALAYGLAGDETAAQELLEHDLEPQAVVDTLAFYRHARDLSDIAPAAGP